MAISRVIVSLLCILLITQSEAAKGKGKDKKKDRGSSHGASHGASQEADKLTDRIEAIEARLDAMGGGESGSGCPGNNVHFFFHGDGDHDHKEGENVHINLHLDHDDHHHGHGHRVHKARCEMPDNAGHILIVQSDHDDHANFLFDFDHIGDANSNFKVHVHEFGDLSDGCDKLGGHFAPDGEDIGDLGMLESDSDGAVINEWKNDTMLELSGHDSIIGRGIIVHDSNGAVLSCCVIGVAEETDEHHGHSMGDHSGHSMGDHSAHMHH